MLTHRDKRAGKEDSAATAHWERVLGPKAYRILSHLITGRYGEGNEATKYDQTLPDPREVLRALLTSILMTYTGTLSTGTIPPHVRESSQGALAFIL